MSLPALPDAGRVVLLDLNYTLVANSAFGDRRPMAVRLASEEYRGWLVELLRDEYVVLVTARPEGWREPTLRRIEAETGWMPQAAFFNAFNERPPAAKLRVLTGVVAPQVETGRLLAIESNPATRAMYESHGVFAVPVPKEGPWERLPVPTAT